MQPDYLIIGSGLSALTFGALMANAGKTVHNPRSSRASRWLWAYVYNG